MSATTPATTAAPRASHSKKEATLSQKDEPSVSNCPVCLPFSKNCAGHS